MWWEERLKGRPLFIALFLVCSIAAVSAGFYFREHYFILLLPMLAWLSGLAISRSLYLLKNDRTIELFLAIGSLLLLLAGAGTAFVQFGSIWFTLSATAAHERIYHTTLFSQCASAGRYIHERAAPGARIAVLGSEPEIYFYGKRRSATGYIYMYPLMEAHEHAARLQEQMIAELERTRPEYVVYVNVDFSWLTRAGSETKIFTWWESYWPAHYNLDQTFNVTSDAKELIPGEVPRETPTRFEGANYVLLFKRKPAPGE
jgi:hypothetical protein